jgi:hypothetical protein
MMNIQKTNPVHPALDSPEIRIRKLVEMMRQRRVEEEVCLESPPSTFKETFQLAGPEVIDSQIDLKRFWLL